MSWGVVGYRKVNSVSGRVKKANMACIMIYTYDLHIYDNIINH